MDKGMKTEKLYLFTIPETVYHVGHVKAYSEEEALMELTRDGHNPFDYVQDKDGGFYGDIEIECRGTCDSPGQRSFDLNTNHKSLSPIQKARKHKYNDNCHK